MATPREVEAMRRALELAICEEAPVGPNPRVGCVVVSPDGASIAEGFHRGAGTDHAEVDALRQAGGAARGVSGNAVWGYLSGNGLLSAVAGGHIAAHTAVTVLNR